MKLSEAIDRVNAAHFWNEKLSATERKQLAKVISDAYAKPGAYANTFALSPSEAKVGVMLFTGERAVSASAKHISGEEACRALRLLNVTDKSIRSNLDNATKSLLKCLDRAEADRQHRMGGNAGLFCCGRCSVAVWRHVLAGGFDRHEERLRTGVSHLKKLRDGEGKWQYFPFWYTISALAEMDVREAIAEIDYAHASLRRAALKTRSKDEFDRRRSEIARRALAKLK